MNSIIDIKSFINGFFKRKGAYILFSIIFNKVITFTLSFYVIHQLATQEFGNISYAYNIISFIVPFMGFGIYQSLGRFGPISKSQQNKNQLFKFVFYRGIAASVIIIGVVFLLSGLITSTLPKSQSYLIWISFLVLSLFIFETIKIYYRIYGLNKFFAYLEISHSILLLISGVVLTYFFDGLGYISALLISPLLISLYLLLKHKILSKTGANNFSKEEKSTFWKYGFFTSLGGLTSKLLFTIDILMIGFLINSEADVAHNVALYKVASIIPFSLLFIPSGFIQTDIIKLTQEYQNKTFLKKYIVNYMKVFAIVSIIIAFGLSFFSEFIMSMFGSEYQSASNLIPVFSVGIIGAFVFRNLFGNLMDAIGWAKVSAITSSAALILDIILNYFLVGKYGIIGAAYSTSILLWVSGLALFLIFIKYLKSLD